MIRVRTGPAVLLTAWLIPIHGVFADTATFTRHTAMDTGPTRHAAVSYLLPKGWKAEDAVHWDISHRSAPLTLSFVDTSSDGKYAIRWINTQAFSYGGGQGQAPPDNPTDLIVTVFQNGHPGVDVSVVNRQETPTASEFKATAMEVPKAEICSVTMRYVLDGVPMETKSGFHFDGYSVPRFRSGLWTLSNITSVTGPQSAFPKAMKLGGIVLSSRQWNPQFFEQYREIVFWLLKQARDEGQAYLNAQFAAMRRNYADLSNSNRSAFEAQEAAKDKNTQEFCDYVLDQQRYSDGTTEFILPSGYKNAATDGTNFEVSDDPNFQPGKGYRPLTKVP